MKKTLLLVFLILFTTSLSFAQQPQAPAPVKPVITVPAEIKSLTGKVDSVSLADPAKGTKSEIVVVDDKGAKCTLLLKATTTLYDANWKAITLDKIQKNDRVSVKYIAIKEGLNEARSVNIMKQ